MTAGVLVEGASVCVGQVLNYDGAREEERLEELLGEEKTNAV